jgi:hypothetical protein
MVRANKIVQTAQVTLLAMALVIPAGLFAFAPNKPRELPPDPDL